LYPVGLFAADFMGKMIIGSALWSRYVEGDMQAQEIIYKSFFRCLYQYGMKIHPDDYLVKDCIQETMIAFFEKRDSLSFSPVLHTYLFRTLRNKIIDELRAVTRNADLANGLAGENDSIEEDPEICLIRFEDDNHRRKVVDAAIQLLTGHQREILYLKFAQGMEYIEIAEIFGVDIASARTLVYRSLKSIKAIISGKNTKKA
jgi:RNA polymerase sigma factor (sigma-70 family)